MHIEIDEIAKSFGQTTALHPVSLAIPSGALVALPHAGHARRARGRCDG